MLAVMYANRLSVSEHLRAEIVCWVFAISFKDYVSFLLILSVRILQVHRCKETYARMFGTPMPEAAAAVDTALASAPKLVGGGIHLLDNVSRSFGMGGSRESK